MSLKLKKKKDILIVDDDLDVLAFLRKILENAGYNVIHANTAQDAVECVNKFAPHLILLDLVLNKSSGLNVIESLKKTSPNLSPIIMMSAKNDKKTTLSCMAKGAVDFLSKPLSSNLILQRVKKILKDFELPTLYFDENINVKAQTFADLLKLNEISCVIRSGVKLKGKTHLEYESKYLKIMGVDKCPLYTKEDGKVSDPGVYDNECFFRGVPESSALKIRKLKVVKK